MRLIFFLILILLCTQSEAWCFKEAGQRYHIDPVLLLAIAIRESDLNPAAVGVNLDKNGAVLSRDYGLMQINDSNVAALKKMGVINNSEELLSNSCLNIQAGAWVLANSLKKCGMTWGCLGSYNAGFMEKNRHLRLRYAQDIFNIYHHLHNSNLTVN